MNAVGTHRFLDRAPNAYAFLTLLSRELAALKKFSERRYSQLVKNYDRSRYQPLPGWFAVRKHTVEPKKNPTPTRAAPAKGPAPKGKGKGVARVKAAMAEVTGFFSAVLEERRRLYPIRDARGLLGGYRKKYDYEI